jgi:hypothetical protein
MAALTNKITLSPSRDIPFDKLVLSQANVRRVKAGVAIEELAEDIARRGLLQGLSVRPVAGTGKASVDTPRRAMGDLLGNAVRFGVPGDVMAAGEGIETVLSLRCVLPGMAMAAALSAAHLAAILFPDTLRQLYIVRDDDPAGDDARDRLVERVNAAGIAAIVLSPALGGFNKDLRRLGTDVLWQWFGFSAPLRASAASWNWRFSRKGDAGDGDVVAGIARMRSIAGEDRAGLREGDRPSAGPDRQWLRPAIFRRARPGRFPSRSKIAGLRHPPLPLRPGGPLRHGLIPKPVATFGDHAVRAGCRSVPPDGFGCPRKPRRSRSNRRSIPWARTTSSQTTPHPRPTMS